MRAETLAAVLLALTLVWLFARNRSALLRYKATLDGRPATPSAKCAWAISVFAPWTGPAIPLAALIATGLALRARYLTNSEKVAPHHSRARTALCVRVSIENIAVVSVATALLVVALWTLTGQGD